MSAAARAQQLPRRLLAEGLGTALLLSTVVGSGIMAERLAGGNVAVALMGNTIPTGAILIVLIGMFAPVSGAHLNPAVTAVFALRREIVPGEAMAYACVQVAGGFAGVMLANLMFDLAPLQVSATARGGTGRIVSEVVATAGLVLVILGTRRARPEAVTGAVGLYITAAYWFTASTSFANPAVTLARMASDTFAGIAPASVPAFLMAQIFGAGIGLWLALALWPEPADVRRPTHDPQPI